MAIIFCSCLHEYQDKKYGKQNRVGNPTEKNKGRVHRCTVCGKETEQVIRRS